MDWIVLIDGEWRSAATGTTIAEVPHCGREDVKAAVDAARGHGVRPRV